MKYDVYAWSLATGQIGGEFVPQQQVRAAVGRVKAMHPQCTVYVRWFRWQDGAHGWFNPPGRHDTFGGQAW